jgi:MFS family permease
VVATSTAGTGREPPDPDAVGAGPSTPTGELEPQPTPLAPLRERNYRRYFIGNVLSNLGTFCQGIAQSLLVFNLTGSTFLVGVVNFAQFAGVLVLAPWSGTVADRFDRKRVILLTQFAAGVITGVLTVVSLLGLATAPVVIVTAGLLGITSAFSLPAFRAMIPQLVTPRNLGRAVNLDSVAVNMARAIGPVGGAALVAALSPTWAFGINSLSFFVLCIALAGVHPAAQRIASSAVGFREGLRSVRARPVLAAMLFIVAACGVAADPPSTLGPEIATSFGGGDALAGLILGGFGAGAVVAAFVAGAEAVRHHRKVAILLAILVFGMVLLALSPWLALVLAGSVIAGFGYLASQTRTSSMMYRIIADHERGRIMAMWSVAFIGIRPIASLVDGAIASVAGTAVATLAMATPAAIAVVVSLVLERRERAALNGRGAAVPR